ncbi:uncharacterized protein LOC125227387 [Leguminivora glycinivorella]|uniref:uncharacterized protein LOC125227387 n=1 Tax=Leguminivora glycinivorella TaxID=1035111 RepID=UPI00200EAC6B|nr:uncharacterized protein LOC125227387 [Leguminivora glycinivorella]
MSPLACSVVALAALFAVSNAASVEDPFCANLFLGDSSLQPGTEFTMNVSGGEVIIPNRCPLASPNLWGQYLKVCNEETSLPEIRPFTFGGRPYEKVNIDCPKSTRGCDRLELKVTQLCNVDPIRKQG